MNKHENEGAFARKIIPGKRLEGSVAEVLMARGRAVWLLAAIPLLWCLVSAATYIGMGLHAGILTPAIAVAALLWSAVARRGERTATPVLP